jgi:hypothetical protein
MTDGEKFFVFVALGWCVVLTFLGANNSREAHRHTHELACHVGATELCDYHEAESHE